MVGAPSVVIGWGREAERGDGGAGRGGGAWWLEERREGVANEERVGPRTNASTDGREGQKLV